MFVCPTTAGYGAGYGGQLQGKRLSSCQVQSHHTDLTVVPELRLLHLGARRVPQAEVLFLFLAWLFVLHAVMYQVGARGKFYILYIYETNIYLLKAAEHCLIFAGAMQLGAVRGCGLAAASKAVCRALSPAASVCVAARPPSAATARLRSLTARRIRRPAQLSPAAGAAAGSDALADAARRCGEGRRPRWVTSAALAEAEPVVLMHPSLKVQLEQLFAGVRCHGSQCTSYLLKRHRC